MDSTRNRFRRGQSLVEILVGIAVGAIFIIGSAAIVASSLQANQQTATIQTNTELANQLMGNVKAWAAAGWSNVLSVATGSMNSYYLTTSTSPFVVASGTEFIVIGSTTYYRFFYLSDVYRDSNGNVTTTISGNTYDPSTKLVTVTANPNANASVATQITTLIAYLTRNQSNVLNQSNWSGGSGQNSVMTETNNEFSADSNVTVTTGAIVLTSTGLQTCNE